MRTRRFNLTTAAILCLALLVRLLGAVSRPIWYDEAFSILFAEKGLSAMLSGTLTSFGGGAAEEHPLGYYILLWSWMKIFGASVLSTRLFSVLTGIVTVYLVYVITLEVSSDERTARLAMLFAALAPFQIHYAQEIRMYSMLAMWLLLATFAYQRAAKTMDWRLWGLFSVSATLAQYTHHLAAFYLVALAFLPILQKKWKAFRAVVIAGLCAFVLYLPWAVHLPAQFSKTQTAYWLQRPDISKLFTLLLVYVTNTPVPPSLVAGALGIVLIIVIVGLIQTVRHTRQTGATDGLRFLYLSFVPPIFLLLFSLWKPVYVERALLPSGAVFCIWLAWAIRKTNLAVVVQYSLLGLLGAAAVLGIYEHATYHDFPYGPFKELDASLRQRMEPGDVILHSNKLSMLPALVFDRDLPQSFIGDQPGSATDTLAPATQRVLQVTSESDIQLATRNAERVWYIIYKRALEEQKAAGNPTHPDLEYLNSQYNLELEEQWDGLQLFLYVKTP